MHRFASLAGLALILPSVLATAPAAAAVPQAPRALVPLVGVGTVARAADQSNPKATFGIGPITPGQTEQPFFSYQVPAGGNYSDKVGVFNYSTVPLDLTIYPADLVNGSDGSIGVPPSGTDPVDAGAWIHLESATVKVRVPAATARSAGLVTLPFTISVPSSAAPGDHAGALVASLRTLGKNPKGQNVILDQRVGSRVFIRVPGALRPELSVDEVTASYAGSLNPLVRGTGVVTYKVRNSGNVRLEVHQAVSVAGLVGGETAASPPDIPLLLPGGVATVTASIDGILPEILLTATVSVDGKAGEGDTVNAAPHAEGSTRFWAIPWILLAVLFVLIGGVLWWWRRRQATPPPPSAGRRSKTDDASRSLVGAATEPVRGRHSP